MLLVARCPPQPTALTELKSRREHQAPSALVVRGYLFTFAFCVRRLRQLSVLNLKHPTRGPDNKYCSYEFDVDSEHVNCKYGI